MGGRPENQPLWDLACSIAFTGMLVTLGEIIMNAQNRTEQARDQAPTGVVTGGSRASVTAPHDPSEDWAYTPVIARDQP
jgi:hypothetical protein